jgi:two-component system, NarL family, nitrate/nitrite response regulator NarL
MTNPPIRIVIADDHAIFRDGLRRLLASEGDFEVVGQASDGKEAVILAGKLKPDILLLDLAMPRVPGMAALRELAQQELPVYTILLTASIQGSEVTSALQLGARGIVLKASPPEVLLAGIRAVCKGEFCVGTEIVATWVRSGQPHASSNPEAYAASRLTLRESEIVSAIRDGKSNKEIAAKFSISEETVKRHLSNIFGKLDVSSRLELAVLANRHDLGHRERRGSMYGADGDQSRSRRNLSVGMGQSEQDEAIPADHAGVKHICNPHQPSNSQNDQTCNRLAA